MMYKSKTGKNWIEMDNKELREEIGHLILQLDKTTAKNKRRRTALKNLNTGVLIKHKFMMDQANRVKYLETAIDHWRRKAALLESELGDVVNRVVHDGLKLRDPKTEHGPKVDVQPTRRWFHFGRGARGVSGT